MSNCTPAALKASPRYLRSAVSQRTDDFESGRMTPILPLTAPPAAVVAAPAVVAPPLLLLLLSPPQAASVKVKAVATAVNPMTDLRIPRSFLGVRGAVAGRRDALGCIVGTLRPHRCPPVRSRWVDSLLIETY